MCNPKPILTRAVPESQTTEYSFVHLTDAELCQLIADHSNPRTGDPEVKRAAADCLERRDELRRTVDAVMAGTRARVNRRSFLKSVAGLFGVAALVLVPNVPESIPVPTLTNLDSDPRAAVIDEWHKPGSGYIDQAIVKLETYWSLVGEARSAPVDAARYVAAESATRAAMEDLLHRLELVAADDLARACTGLEPRQIYGEVDNG